MELIVFDLDGTLLGANAQVSDHTRQTLVLLQQHGIAYTVATGRTLHAARDLLHGHGFTWPHIYKNGVVVWRPDSDCYTHSNLLTNDEVRSVIDAFVSVDVTPFIFTVEPKNKHVVYHAPLRTVVEERLCAVFARDRGMEVLPVSRMSAVAEITNISALGSQEAIETVANRVKREQHLIAYVGEAFEGERLYWLDIHHSAASKGVAVNQLKDDLGVSRVICFGDSDNDLSMFAVADECYAPSNAKIDVKEAATAVIGHHDEDGISRFLRQRFNL
jgi:Cof subfamily protein (haloacid dehalogenase superfamily)